MQLRRALTVAAVGTMLAGCPAARQPKTISLRMVGSPPEASVTVDDIFVGRLETVAARGVALPLGPHRVSVEAAGYLPWDRVVDAREAAGPLRLDVRLRPIPD